MFPEEVKRKFRTLIALRDKRDQAKIAAKNAEQEYRDYEAALWEEMDETGVEGALKVPLGSEFGTVTFTAAETMYGRVLDEHKLVDWLHANDLIESHTDAKLSKARLNEIIRERLEAGEPLPEGADFTPTRYIKISIPARKTS